MLPIQYFADIAKYRPDPICRSDYRLTSSWNRRKMGWVTTLFVSCLPDIQWQHYVGVDSGPLCEKQIWAPTK